MPSRNPNGVGSFFSKTMRGKTRYCWTVSINGKRKQFSASTQAKLKQKIKEWQAHFQSSSFDAKINTLAEFIEIFLSVKKATLKQRTFDGYKSICQNFLNKPPLGNKKLVEIKPMMIEEFLTSLIPRYSASYASDIRRCLHTVLNSAVQQGYLQVNPCSFAKGPRQQQKEIIMLTNEEIKNMLNIARKGQYIFDKNFYENDAIVLQKHGFYYALLLTIFTGIRRGECYGLTWKNVNLDECWIKIIQCLSEDSSKRHLDEPKTASSKRTISIPNFVAEELKIWQKEQQTYADKYTNLYQNKLNLLFPNTFGNLMNLSNINSRYWKKLKAACGLPQNYHWHYLRHNHASALIKMGVPITEITRRLGHSSSAVTLKVYSHAFRNDDSAVIKALETMWNEGNNNVR